MSALAHFADSSWTFPEVREVPILLQKSPKRKAAVGAELSFSLPLAGESGGGDYSTDSNATLAYPDAHAAHASGGGRATSLANLRRF